MRILIVRHGDPDYIRDSLTKRGWQEAEMVSQRLVKEDIDEFYVSPLGRAQDTASVTLKKLNREAVTLDWLREFSPRIHRPDKKLIKTVCWDWLPQDWTIDENFYDANHWTENPVFENANVKEVYDNVCKEFDAFLATKGYVREGKTYHVTQENHDTICFVCHFGLEMVLISHLLSISPMPLWHGFCAAPASVTTIYTEERKKGIASFRVSAFGDVSHFYVHDEKPSFAARYAECYSDKELH